MDQRPKFKGAMHGRSNKSSPSPFLIPAPTPSLLASPIHLIGSPRQSRLFWLLLLLSLLFISSTQTVSVFISSTMLFLCSHQSRLCVLCSHHQPCILFLCPHQPGCVFCVHIINHTLCFCVHINPGCVFCVHIINHALCFCVQIITMQTVSVFTSSTT